MHVHDLIREQHQEAKALYEQYLASTSDSEKKDLADQLLLSLTVHAVAEEDTYYPAIADTDEEDLVRQFGTEHTGAKAMIARCSLLETGSDAFDGALRSLMAAIIAHVAEEEETAMPEVETRLTKEQLEEIGVRMQARSEELRESKLKRLLGALTP